MTDKIGGDSPTPVDFEAAAAEMVSAEWGRHPSRVRRVSSDLEETFLVEFAEGPRGALDRAVLKVAEPGRPPLPFDESDADRFVTALADTLHATRA